MKNEFLVLQPLGEDDYRATHPDMAILFESWQLYLDQAITAKNHPDYNFLFRFEFHPPGHYYTSYTLVLFYYLQRRGYAMSVTVTNITPADEEHIVSFLAEMRGNLLEPWGSLN